MSISTRMGHWDRSVRGLLPSKRQVRTHRTSPRLESLEGRALLATSLLKFPVDSGPGYSDSVTSTTVGSDGNVWFTDNVSSSGRLAVRIGKVTPQGGVTLYPLISGFQSYQIVAGPDRNLWFNEVALSGGTSAMAKITTAGVTTTYPLGVVSGQTLTSGPKSSLWFSTTDLVGRPELNQLTTNGTLTKITFAVPNSIYSVITQMTASSDGQFQVAGVTFPTVNAAPLPWVGQLTTDGVLTRFTPSLVVRGTRQTIPLRAWGITIGYDGNPWYTLAGQVGSNPPKVIGRMGPTGIFRLIPLRIASTLYPEQIVSASNGLDFSVIKNNTVEMNSRGTIGHVSTTGKVSYTHLPRVKDAHAVTTTIEASALTIAPDQNLWFAGKLGTGGAEIDVLKVTGKR